jgi:catechol 2,3-dioxygenase-like lactoylglutathione lyase family enzyme
MRLHHIALRCEDLKACQAFYEGLLGLPEMTPPGGSGTDGKSSIWFRAGDAVLMLETRLRGRGADRGSGHLLSFAVETLEPWIDKLRSAGIPIDDRTEATLYFRDPSGHRLALSRYRFEDP